jgi:beta-mannosidase
MRPKMAYYGVRRELRPVVIGVARSAQKVEVWGVSSLAQAVEVQFTLEGYVISSGERVFVREYRRTVPGNQAMEIDSLEYVATELSDTVFSVRYTVPSGETFRSSGDWPQPLKYVSFKDRTVTLSVEGETVTVCATKLVKGVILDVEGEDDSNLSWSDNGFDLMTNETLVVIAKGLSGRSVKVTWYDNI